MGKPQPSGTHPQDSGSAPSSLVHTLDPDIRTRTRVVAHRGASGVRLENTLSAVEHAAEGPADGLEVDVMLSADGVVVVFHDDDLARLAGRPERIDTLEWSTIAEVRMPDGGRIPRLEDVLEAWPADRWLNVELKRGGADLVRATLAVLADRPGTVLSSADLDVLDALRSRELSFETALIVARDSPPWLGVSGPGFYGVAAVHLEHALCDSKTVARHLERGREVGAWVVDEPGRATELVELGVSRIFTDYP